MEVFVRGARSSRQDWEQAHTVPVGEIPPLDSAQKAEARRGNISEEELARIAYAEHLWQQREAEKILRFGRWLNGKIEERNSYGNIQSIELDTLSGKLHIEGAAGKEPFSFDLDEDLVERFLITGMAELERAIFRVLEIFVPIERTAKAS